MQFHGIHHLARFIERPNRFLAIVKLVTSDRIVKVHVPDPGRLKELLQPDIQIILREATNLKRKTRFSLVGVKFDQIWVNIDSLITNHLFQEEYTKLRYFKNYQIIKPEFSLGKSRIDFLMGDPQTNKEALVEVKGVTLVENKVALFPDAPTIRGTKHINKLINALDKGYQAFLIFLIKRIDADKFSPNWETDPHFAEALVEATKRGVKICAAKCDYDPIVTKELKIMDEVPITQF